MNWNILLLTVLGSLAFSAGKNCVKYNSCMCIFDDNSGTVSLYNVGRQDNVPLINNYWVDNNYYYYNPCYPFTKTEGCPNVAACVYNNSISAYCDLGDDTSVDFSYDGVNVIASYSALECGFPSTSIVTLICDPAVDFPVGKALGEFQERVYGFSVRSKFLCASDISTTESATTESITTEPEPVTTGTGYTTGQVTTGTGYTEVTTEPGTTSRAGIFCDYKTLLGQTLRMCIEQRTGNTITPFAPLYLNQFGDVSRFCSNVNMINTCVQDSIASCGFDSRVTTLFGTSGLGLQAAYDSICAHPLTSREQALDCVTNRGVDEYRISLNNFINYVDESSDPFSVCSRAPDMIIEMKTLISDVCPERYPVWTLFWDNFISGCQ